MGVDTDYFFYAISLYTPKGSDKEEYFADTYSSRNECQKILNTIYKHRFVSGWYLLFGGSGDKTIDNRKLINLLNESKKIRNDFLDGKIALEELPKSLG